MINLVRKKWVPEFQLRHLKDQWVKEYEKAVKDGIKPRVSLYKAYTFVQQNNAFPKYILNLWIKRKIA
jgi:hypothetical protein